MRPTEVPEFHFARSVVEHKLLLIDVLLGRLRSRLVQLRHILAGLSRGQPAGRFEAFQLLGNGLKRQGSRAGLRPQKVAVQMIAVMMGIEHVLHRFGRNAPGVGQGCAGPAREIGVHHDEIVLHFDKDVIAMALLQQIALAKPNAGRNQAHRLRLGVGAGNQQRDGAQNSKAQQQ